MDEYAARFLTAYNEIDGFLRKLCKASKEVSFSQLVADASNPKKSPPQHAGVVRYYAEDLREYGDLRNAIVHEYRNFQVIATPHPDATEDLEAIRKRLLDPPKVVPLFARDVMQCKLDDSIGTAAKRMVDKDFSQIPVWCGTVIATLLTTDTIARWLAESFAANKGIMKEAPVKEVLDFAERSDDPNFQLLAPDATVFDALGCFDACFRRGTRIDAILITQGTKKSNSPIGIISVSDMPKLHASLA